MGVIMDRAIRPGRVLAMALTGYAIALGFLTLTLGDIARWESLIVAVCAGSFMSSMAGGWSSILPAAIGGSHLERVAALDGGTYDLAGLVGPASAGFMVLYCGGKLAALMVSLLVLASAVVAWRVVPETGINTREGGDDASRGAIWSGWQTIVYSRSLRRVTVVSMASYLGLGMLSVTIPLVARHVTGSADYGGVLVSAMSLAALGATAAYAKWAERGGADLMVGMSPLMMALGLGLLMVPSWPLAIISVLAIGVGDGPQTAALIAVRFRDSPVAVRSQVFLTGSGLKVAALALGMVVAGRLEAASVSLTLTIALVVEVLATGIYFVLS